MDSFVIDIQAHHWLANADPSEDPCSHGRVFVRVNGEPVVPAASYRKAVADFARQVWSLFDEVDKRIADSEDARGYAAFKEEYLRRLRQSHAPVAPSGTDHRGC